MNTYRKTAITVGILLIACTVTSILGPSLVSSILRTPGYLNQLAGNSNQTIIATLLEFIWAATGAGIAIGLYPVLRKHNGPWRSAPLVSESSREYSFSSARSACYPY